MACPLACATDDLMDFDPFFDKTVAQMSRNATGTYQNNFLHRCKGDTFALMMDAEQFRSYCMAKPGTSEDFPFGEENLCLRVGGKIFAIADLVDQPFRVNLKCDPDRAIELREQYEDIIPGYHMNKKHWNTVYFEGSIPVSVLRELIDHSYQLILDSLKKSDRAALGL
jgi:predicted DNA-binding protein (MmcQ/YjbR family)